MMFPSWNGIPLLQFILIFKVDASLGYTGQEFDESAHQHHYNSLRKSRQLLFGSVDQGSLVLPPLPELRVTAEQNSPSVHLPSIPADIFKLSGLDSGEKSLGLNLFDGSKTQIEKSHQGDSLLSLDPRKIGMVAGSGGGEGSSSSDNEILRSAIIKLASDAHAGRGLKVANDGEDGTLSTAVTVVGGSKVFTGGKDGLLSATVTGGGSKQGGNTEGASKFDDKNEGGSKLVNQNEEGSSSSNDSVTAPKSTDGSGASTSSVNSKRKETSLGRGATALGHFDVEKPIQTSSADVGAVISSLVQSSPHLSSAVGPDVVVSSFDITGTDLANLGTSGHEASSLAGLVSHHASLLSASESISSSIPGSGSGGSNLHISGVDKPPASLSSGLETSSLVSSGLGASSLIASTGLDTSSLASSGMAVTNFASSDLGTPSFFAGSGPGLSSFIASSGLGASSSGSSGSGISSFTASAGLSASNSDSSAAKISSLASFGRNPSIFGSSGLGASSFINSGLGASSFAGSKTGVSSFAGSGAVASSFAGSKAGASSFAGSGAVASSFAGSGAVASSFASSGAGASSFATAGFARSPLASSGSLPQILADSGTNPANFANSGSSPPSSPLGGISMFSPGLNAPLARFSMPLPQMAIMTVPGMGSSSFAASGALKSSAGLGAGATASSATGGSYTGLPAGGFFPGTSNSSAHPFSTFMSNFFQLKPSDSKLPAALSSSVSRSVALGHSSHENTEHTQHGGFLSRLHIASFPGDKHDGGDGSSEEKIRTAEGRLRSSSKFNKSEDTDLDYTTGDNMRSTSTRLRSNEKKPELDTSSKDEKQSDNSDESKDAKGDERKSKNKKKQKTFQFRSSEPSSQSKMNGTSVHSSDSEEQEEIIEEAPPGKPSVKLPLLGRSVVGMSTNDVKVKAARRFLGLDPVFRPNSTDTNPEPLIALMTNAKSSDDPNNPRNLWKLEQELRLTVH